jgi:hypothetical protein
MLTAAQWNELVPPGTPVRYWSIRKAVEPRFEGVDYLDTRTRSEAWHLGDGKLVVVKVEGIAGGVSIDHLAVDAGRMLAGVNEALKRAPLPTLVEITTGVPDVS